ncbi:hypothetical protein D3C87_2194080 [compost metagenome]
MITDATLPIMKLYAGERLNSRPENDDATAQPSDPHMRIWPNSIPFKRLKRSE